MTGLYRYKAWLLYLNLLKTLTCYPRSGLPHGIAWALWLIFITIQRLLLSNTASFTLFKLNLKALFSKLRLVCLHIRFWFTRDFHLRHGRIIPALTPQVLPSTEGRLAALHWAMDSKKLPVTYKKTTILSKNGTASHFFPQTAHFQVTISIKILEIV